MRTIAIGDCLELLRGMVADARPFDVVLTDPPGAKGMAEWDGPRGGRDS